MRTPFFTVIVEVLFFLSCSRTAVQEQEIFHIDLNKNYPEFPLSLSDIADIRFIKLGGEEQGVLLKNLSYPIHLDDINHKIIAGPLYGTVMIFEEDGSFIRNIGHYGRGPGEYMLRQFYVNPDEKIIGMISDLERKVMQFDYNGILIPNSEKTVGLRFDSHGVRLLNGALFVFNPASQIRYEYAAGHKEEELANKPLHKIAPDTFEEDASFDGIRYANPLVVPLSWETNPEYRWVRGGLAEGISGLMAHSFRSDTTYLIDHDFHVRPFLVNTSHNSGEQFVFPTVETKRHIFCCAKKYGETFYYAIDKSSKEVYKITAVPDDPLPVFLQMKPQFTNYDTSLCPDRRIVSFSMSSLKKHDQSLSADLKSIVDRYDEDANPILMVIEFKE